MKQRLSRMLILLCMVAGLNMALAETDTVHFGFVEWPGVTVKTHVAMETLETLGYDTSYDVLSLPFVLLGVSQRDLDVFLGLWRPTMDSMVQEYLEAGVVTEIGRNMESTIYRPAVPSYVYEAGVQSLADLDDHAEQFGNTFYGIEPGNDGNELFLGMIDDDMYGLGDWELLESSTEGMLTEVGIATENEEWIVFLGWSPHWMNAVYDIDYLDDPEGIWGDDGYVGTLVNTEFAENNPNLARFFEQFKIEPETQSEWIDSYDREGMDAPVVAREWLANNLDLVSSWLEGVESIDGQPAEEVLRAAFE